MNEQYGTLTIRREVAVPAKYNDQSIKYRHATLATYHTIARGECSELINRFCEANNVSRVNLLCEWKFATLI